MGRNLGLLSVVMRFSFWEAGKRERFAVRWRISRIGATPFLVEPGGHCRLGNWPNNWLTAQMVRNDGGAPADANCASSGGDRAKRHGDGASAADGP